MTDGPVASESAGAPEAAEPPSSADDRPQVDEQAEQAVRKTANSDDEADGIGDSDDGDSTGQVGDLRRSKRVGDRTIDQALRSAVAQGDGPAVYVERQEIRYSGRRIFVQKQIMEKPADLDREFQTYEPVDGYQEMAASLDANGVLVLRGAPGSGRHATARMLLRAVGCRRVGTLSANVDDDLFFILHEQLTHPPAGADPLMMAHDGYLLDWTGNAISSGSLSGFAAAVKSASARVVVVVDGTAGERASSDLELFHPWPSARRDLMAKHLKGFLLDHARSCGEEECSSDLIIECQKPILDHQVVESRLRLAPSVLRIVEMARFLAKNLHDVRDKGIGQTVIEWDDSARVLAREILKGNAPPDKPHLIPQQQAFRIAYAVFHEQPLAYVFAAGNLLLELLISMEVRKNPPKSRVFDRSVAALIDARMTAGAADRDDERPRRARLADESLIVSILEVAWDEYEQLRGPLASWLDGLASSSDSAVQVRAAQMVGLLATFDYTGVFKMLIEKWAKAKAVFRTSAALAMDQIDRNTSLSPGVRRQVEAWSRSNLPAEQDTAAKWYGLRTEKADVAKAISELRGIGGRPQLRRSGGLAVAMSLLFLNGYADEVVEELGAWIGSNNPYKPHHAVRTLLILTDPKGAGKQSRTSILKLATGNAEIELALVRIWRKALASRAVGGFAWDSLGDWLVAAGSDEDQSALMEALAVQIFTDALIPRARFNLTLWRIRRPDASLVRRVHDLLSETRGS